jgi:hypothetical protein
VRFLKEKGATMNSYMLRWKLKDETFKRLVNTPVNRRQYAKTLRLLLGSGVVMAHHVTRAATRAPSKALPRRRALCTN